VFQLLIQWQNLLAAEATDSAQIAGGEDQIEPASHLILTIPLLFAKWPCEGLILTPTQKGMVLLTLHLFFCNFSTSHLIMFRILFMQVALLVTCFDRGLAEICQSLRSLYTILPHSYWELVYFVKYIKQ
jgi:hypothetical protein